MPEIEKPLKSENMAEVVPDWDAKFVEIDQADLFELILAANYMDIKSLLDLTCAKVASLIKGKTPEQIRKTFNIVNDFTPEVSARMWAAPRRGAQVPRRLGQRTCRGPARPRRAPTHSLSNAQNSAPDKHTSIHKHDTQEEAHVREENKWCEEAP